MDRKKVSVVIAAYNAADTVALAVQSALAEAETGEVFVVDDCSSDATVEAALRAGDGDPRLAILKQDRNKGPSAARNRAINAATMPFVAILDSDDRFMPGRLARLFSQDDWDFCADNIAFTTDRLAFNTMQPEAETSGRTGVLDLESFLRGNRNSSRVDRNELGFLKPVMRREFLERHHLRYPMNCRLGEDFLLYSKALACGARFRVFEDCGYAAFERANSLSGRHGVEELQSLLDGLERMSSDITGPAKRPFGELKRALRRKIDHRIVLDIRRSKGVAHGVLALGPRMSAVGDILRDKLQSKTLAQERRILISAREFDRLLA